MYHLFNSIDFKLLDFQLHLKYILKSPLTIVVSYDHNLGSVRVSQRINWMKYTEFYQSL